MKKFTFTSTNYKVELINDLLMVKNGEGQLLKGMVVPVLDAVERFNAMVEKVKKAETQKR